MNKLYKHKSKLKLGLFLLFISIFSNSITAQPFFDAGESSLSLISESDQVATEETILVGLDFKLTPGWHTYWTNPGDAGAGATIIWDLPSGFTASEILWPSCLAAVKPLAAAVAQQLAGGGPGGDSVLEGYFAVDYGPAVALRLLHPPPFAAGQVM